MEGRAEGIPGNPRLRAGVVLHRMDLGRRSGPWVIRTPEGRYYIAGEREAALLARLDGTRSFADLAGGPPELDAAARFIQEIWGRGLLEGRAPPPMPAGRTWHRLPLGNPTRLLRPACAALARLPRGAAVPAVAGLMVAGALAAWLQADGLLAYLAPRSLWSRLPGAVLLAWALGIWHETAHALAALRRGARVRAIGVAVVGWRPAFFADIPDLLLLPRRDRIAVAAAGPTGDALLASLALVSAQMVPDLADPALSLAAVALIRVAWNMLPALRTDGAFLLAELLGIPGLERTARRCAARWLLRIAGRAGAMRDPSPGGPSPGILLYGLISAGLEVGVGLLLMLRALSARAP